MKTVTFNCEVITPMFLSGADGKTPELRPPSIKGALRFWWRALKGYADVNKLYEDEGKIFGAADENVGKSQITLRVTDRKLQSSPPIQQNELDASIVYLLYSAIMLNKLAYFKPGSTFKLQVGFSDTCAQSAVDDIFKTIWLLSSFGALGTRARRGAGNLKINLPDTQFLSSSLAFDTNGIDSADKLQAFFMQNLAGMVGGNGMNRYATLKGSRIVVGENASSWEEALKKFAAPFWNFRQKHEAKVAETPNFGFPVRHGNRNTTMVAGPAHGREKLQRRSSPLIFRVVKTSEACFFPLLIFLHGELIPNHYEIMDSKGGNRRSPSNQIVLDFLKSLNNTRELTL